MLRRIFIAALAAAPTLCAQTRSAPKTGYTSWPSYGGPNQIRYSSLTQINRGNAGKLEVAWSYDTGDMFKGSEMQCNPLIADGVMYATTPKLRVIALDAATGKLKWSFDPFEANPSNRKARNRGVTYAQGRIYVAASFYLHAVDAKTGKLVPEFGVNGRVDLREGLGRPSESLNVIATSPGAVYKDLIIMGSVVSEDLPSAPGDIRAYDLKTGKIRWTFHTIPRPGEFGYETWPPDAWKYTGGVNNWAGMAVDEKLGIVYAPTGSASFDFYGSNRIGDNLFANTLLALNAETGERIWHFQAVKHDVWDRDFPSPPSLVTIRKNGKMVDAVAQITKSGHVYAFDRKTGDPIFPIEFRKAPPSTVDGEKLAEIQPLPLGPPAFARQALTEDMLSKRTPEINKLLRERFKSYKSAGQFTPPGFEGTIVFPGYDGGGEWGGSAFDPETGLFYVNSNEMAWVLRLVERKPAGARMTGSELYTRNCASCHLENRRGVPPEFPPLIDIAQRRPESDIREVVRKGAGRMPGFAQLGDEAVNAILKFVITGENANATVAQGERPQLKYRTDGYNKFLDPDGYPAVEPPWGTLNAIDLDKGEIRWKIPFGEFPELAAKGMKNTGTENYGGPVVTAGGVVFIGATNHDKKFHVFDKLTGKLLWETTMPAAGNATPAVYEVNGRQFVAIAAGGGKSGAPSGGTYVAFALPLKE